ncbi:hypothetical protein [Burkholderia cenocepacia]|uniref:hypothetical protein n=1 Tax=Burkholderia cenocepacia TaxID=95486 RepID=UPI00163CCA56|nr:hypothetical protein [Burkholderia cenocepacia]
MPTGARRHRTEPAREFREAAAGLVHMAFGIGPNLGAVFVRQNQHFFHLLSPEWIRHLKNEKPPSKMEFDSVGCNAMRQISLKIGY